MATLHYSPTFFSADQGDTPLNAGWLETLNVVPYGVRGWLIDPFFNERVDLATVPVSNGDIRGIHVNAQNGTNGWKIYVGTDTQLAEIEPATWTPTVRGTGFSSLDLEVGWQMVGYGPHEIAVGGHSIAPQIRLNDAGNFATMITNSEPETSTGNWPPKAKYVAVWGDSVAIANLTDVGPASSFGNTSGILWWVSKVQDARTFGTLTANPGDGTTFGYLADDHGDITGLAGGSRFGAIFKARAAYRVEYYAGDRVVNIERISEGIGTIFPNSIVTAGDEIYFMSTEGPAVIRQAGPPELIGQDFVQRTLFDESWVITNYNLNVDQSAAYLCYGVYQPVQNVVSWYYRSTQDAMDHVLHYNRDSGRWAIGERKRFVTAGTKTVLAAAMNPRLETQRFSGGQGLILIDNSGKLWESSPTGLDRWRAQPTFRTPFLALSRDDGDRLGFSRVDDVLIYHSLNTGVGDSFRPEVTVELVSKNNLFSGTVNPTLSGLEDEYGFYRFDGPLPAPFQQITIKYGNASTIANIENLGRLPDAIDINFDDAGGAP